MHATPMQGEVSRIPMAVAEVAKVGVTEAKLDPTTAHKVTKPAMGACWLPANSPKQGEIMRHGT